MKTAEGIPFLGIVRFWEAAGKLMAQGLSQLKNFNNVFVVSN